MKRGFCMLLAVVAAMAPVRLWPQARSFELDDLLRVVRISDPQIAPDGRSIAIVVAKADLDTNRWDSEIALVDVVSGALRQLTRGRRGVGHPRWSPDGQSLG